MSHQEPGGAQRTKVDRLETRVGNELYNTSPR